MTFKTDTLRRLAEVIIAMKMESIYYEEGFFILTKEKLVIYEDLENCSQLKQKLSDHKFVKIHKNGNLTYDTDNEEVRIKFCKNCNKFYFSRKLINVKESCTWCKSSSIKLLSNNGRIPGWYGKNETTLLDYKSALTRLDNYTGDVQEEIKRILEKLSGKPKFITLTPLKIEKIKQLAEEYPNMQEVIDYILECANTSQLKKNMEFSFKPFVLVGGPGCGKTSFTTRLCEIILGKKALKIDLGNNIANFTISGSDPSFKLARNGLIIESMFSGEDKQPVKNPIIHFDELDKINREATYTVETIFYSILERCNARNFFDNYIGMNVDASGINYIFTANTLENIPSPIINRLKIFKINDYTQEQLRGPVIDSFYKNWIKSNNIDAEYLPETLSEEIKDRILSYSNGDPRSIDDAISRVCNETLLTDQKTGHLIALFSPSEMHQGWENFRGHRTISKQCWALPEGFIKENIEYYTRQLLNA